MGLWSSTTANPLPLQQVTPVPAPEGRALTALTSRRANMVRTRRVTRRLCHGLGLAAVWCAAVKVFMLVADQGVMMENTRTNSVSSNSDAFRKHGVNVVESSHTGAVVRKSRSHRNEKEMMQSSNSNYSSLLLDDLRSFHLGNGPQIILEKSPQHFNFIIKESDLCEKFVEKRKKQAVKSPSMDEYTPSTGRPPILAVAVVSSSLRNWRERQLVRATWGHPAIVRLSGVPVVFMVGSTSSSRGQQSLVKESLMFRDIVQAEFLDSYNNLSLKSMAGVSWAAIHCKQANWVLKTDDDMCINVFDLKAYLLNFMRTLGAKKPSHVTTQTTEKGLLTNDHSTVSHSKCLSTPSQCLLCDKVTEGAPVVREKDSLNGVGIKEWGDSTYPPYCNGVGFLVPLPAVERMVAAAAHTRLLRVEDVFMTGVLARAAGLRLHRIHQYSPWLFAMTGQSTVEHFLNGTRLTLELDRDLEWTAETPGSVWRSLLERHGLQEFGNTVPV